MRRCLAVFVLVLPLCSACGDDGSSPTAAAPTTTTVPATTVPAVAAAEADALQADLERRVAAELAAHPDLPGELLEVDAPGVHVEVADGFADGTVRQEPATIDHDFRIASVTKTFTAATILRLVEQGELDLDATIDGLLPAPFLDALVGDGYAVDEITVRNLLWHSAGLADYAHGADYFAAAAEDLQHRWTPLEQIQFAMDHGDPLWAPGEGYVADDTSYVLLGQIIERTTGLGLARAFRTLLHFDELGLDRSWLETLEPAPEPGGPRMHNLYGTLDTNVQDPSVDLYGGGGLVSTVGDLARFTEALWHGQVFDDPATFDAMMEISPAQDDDDIDVAMGLYRVHAAGHTCWEHTGFYGTVAFHCPDLDLTITRHVGQAFIDDDFWLGDINIAIVREVADLLSA